MIHTPRKAVTRFFVPLIDVLILLFCIFLLLPFVSEPQPIDPNESKAPEKPLPEDAKELQKMVQELQSDLKRAQIDIKELEKQRVKQVNENLSVRVLEVDPTDGTLFYYVKVAGGSERRPIKAKADVTDLVAQQKAIAGGRDVFFLIMLPRKVGGFPTAPQLDQMRKWFEGLPLGVDVP